MNMLHKHPGTFSVFLNLRHKREVTGQLHAPALLLGTEPPVRIIQETNACPRGILKTEASSKEAPTPGISSSSFGRPAGILVITVTEQILTSKFGSSKN